MSAVCHVGMFLDIIYFKTDWLFIGTFLKQDNQIKWVLADIGLWNFLENIHHSAPGEKPCLLFTQTLCFTAKALIFLVSFKARTQAWSWSSLSG